MTKLIYGSLSICVLSYLLVAVDNQVQASCAVDKRSKTITECLSLAQSGNSSAQFDMSTRYFTGTDGVKRNEVLAYMWAKICAKNERGTCGKMINILEMNMSKKEIAVAKEMASKCLGSNLKKCE